MIWKTNMFYRWIWGSEVVEVDFEVEVKEGVTEAVTTLEGEIERVTTLEGEIEGVTIEGVTIEGVTIEGVTFWWTGVGSRRTGRTGSGAKVDLKF